MQAVELHPNCPTTVTEGAAEADVCKLHTSMVTCSRHSDDWKMEELIAYSKLQRCHTARQALKLSVT
jgi:hypothetical protein